MSSDRVIHIVDDEPDIVRVVKTVLENEGYTIHSFTNPEQALDDIENICRKKVGMLITDVRMPIYNGFEVARRTRAIVPDVPVIFMTAFEINPSEFERVFHSLEINEFMQKPFNRDQLLAVVKKYLNKG